MVNFKLLFAFIIFVMSVAAGLWPFLKKSSNKKIDLSFMTAESFACGVFLGAALLHMLPEAAEDFFRAGIHYPTPFLIAGSVFLLLLLLEQLSASLNKSSGHFTTSLALLTTLMLSIHSLLEGSALGVSSDFATMLIIFIAIIAHKGAASFALATHLNKSGLKPLAKISAFIIFALMTPLGIVGGTWISILALKNLHHPVSLLLAPTFSSMAAGTFLYIGTLHGLERANLIKNCGQTKDFFTLLIGFGLMAVVAIWA